MTLTHFRLSPFSPCDWPTESFVIFLRALGYDILRLISLSGIELNFAWLFGRLEFLLDTICDSKLIGDGGRCLFA